MAISNKQRFINDVAPFFLDSSGNPKGFTVNGKNTLKVDFSWEEDYDGEYEENYRR